MGIKRRLFRTLHENILLCSTKDWKVLGLSGNVFLNSSDSWNIFSACQTDRDLLHSCIVKIFTCQGVGGNCWIRGVNYGYESRNIG